MAYSGCQENLTNMFMRNALRLRPTYIWKERFVPIFCPTLLVA